MKARPIAVCLIVALMMGWGILLTKRSMYRNNQVDVRVHPQLQPDRFEPPVGLKKFGLDVAEFSVNLALHKDSVKENDVRKMVSRALNYSESRRRGALHNLDAIPTAFILCADYYADIGNLDSALECLEHLQAYGGLSSELLARPVFASLKNRPRFQQLVDYVATSPYLETKAEYLILSRRLCTLEDLLALETNPSLPDAWGLIGSVTVVFTAQTVSEEIIRQLEQLQETDVVILAIANEPPGFKTTIPIHVTKESVSLFSMIWFSDSENDVVGFLKASEGAFGSDLIVKTLQCRQDEQESFTND